MRVLEVSDRIAKFDGRSLHSLEIAEHSGGHVSIPKNTSDRSFVERPSRLEDLLAHVALLVALV
jgi:hypothetical protein